jgi:cytidyltransferase-like protein
MAKKVVVTSGYFNPLHVGHLNLIKEARALGDHLVVIVNNDTQVTVKGSTPFMSEKERMEIVGHLKHADEVFLSIDTDHTVANSLEAIARKYPGEVIFAKGGDRNFDNLPEQEKKVCRDFNISVVNNVGGGKVQSSSWLLKSVKAA